MELFSEIYSCYFTAVRKVLEAAQKKTLTDYEITAIINANAFTDSSFFILPYLQSGEWSLLNRVEADILKMPITSLQKSWLKALLNDKRIRLFLDKGESDRLNTILCGVLPLYGNSDFHYFDSAIDGDMYNDEQYINNFRTILSAIKDKSILRIEYDSGKRRRSNNCYMPLKLNYSQRDDKFRLISARIKPNRIDKAILNLSRIKSIAGLSNISSREISESSMDKNTCKEPVVLQILPGRNALERFMLEFASMEKQTEYEKTTDSYVCRIFYDSQDETELLIRILSFGPVIKVLGPENFLAQICERIKKQIALQNE